MGLGAIFKRHHRLTLAADPDAAVRCDYPLTIHPPKTVRKPTFVALTSYQQCIGGFNRWWGRDVARDAHSHLSPIFKNISFSFLGEIAKIIGWRTSYGIFRTPSGKSWISHCNVIKNHWPLHETRWYPRGIQKLVSTCEVPETPTNSTQGGAGPDQLNPKWQDLPQSALGGGGVIQGNSTQSAKICLNLHFWEEGRWWYSRPTHPNCQDLFKSAFGLGWGGWSRPTQHKVARYVQIRIFGEEEGGGGPDQLNPKCQDLSKSAISGGGGGWRGDGSGQHSWNTWVPPLKYFWTKFSNTPASYCITDSLSHT